MIRAYHLEIDCLESISFDAVNVKFKYASLEVSLLDISKYVYLLACLVNWTVQLAWSVPDTEFYIYLTILLAIVVDDLILLNWLFK